MQAEGLSAVPLLFEDKNIRCDKNTKITQQFCFLTRIIYHFKLEIERTERGKQEQIKENKLNIFIITKRMEGRKEWSSEIY